MSALLVFALLGSQEDVIQRTDPARAQYLEAVDLCRAAEELIDKDPEAAAVRLTDLLDRFGQLPRIECRLRIKLFADDAGTSHAFFPYQFRGRARLASAKGSADRVEGAVRDFEQSVRRGATTSEPLLQAARLDWWSSLRPLLARQGWDSGRSAIVAKARGLLGDLAKEGRSMAVAWLITELEPIEARLAVLKRSDPADRRRAGEDASWLRALESLLEGPAAARFRTASTLAGEIAAYRGSFHLKISASPWAEVSRFSREGKEISLEARETPLFVRAELELGDFEVELVHPRLGRHLRRISAAELQEGKTYLLTGDLEAGSMTLRLLP